MKLATQQRTMRLLDRALIGTLFLLALLLLGVELARSAEIIPSVGWSHPTGSEGKAAVFGGLALRNSLLPMVKYEIGAGYRNQKLARDARHRLALARPHADLVRRGRHWLVLQHAPASFRLGAE